MELMKIYTYGGWVIGEPYKFNKQHNGLIINNKESDNVLSVVSAPDNYYVDKIVVYNKEKAVECVIGEKAYVAVDINDIIAQVNLDEGEENNG
jgi:predicted ATP-grasp superfamily ATP-dependent carboligase